MTSRRQTLGVNVDRLLLSTYEKKKSKNQKQGSSDLIIDLTVSANLDGSDIYS